MTGRNKQPYVRFFPSDWLAGTRGLKAGEIGVYITLIALMYDRGEPLIADNSRLARQCGTSAGVFVRALDVLIQDGKIVALEDGRLWNNRVAKEFGWREERSRQAQEAVAERERKRALQWQCKSEKIDSYIGDVEASYSDKNSNEINGQPERPIAERCTEKHLFQKPEARYIEKKDSNESFSSKSDEPDDDVSSLERDIVTAFNEWNTLARKHGLPTAHKLTSARKSKLRARLHSDGLDGWRRALDKLSRSSFCLGLKGDWRASLDFVLQESSFTKLLEGTYDDKQQANGNGAGPPATAVDLERWATRLRYARDNGKWADSWGPMPGQSGCLVPEQLLQRGDGHGWKPLEIRREERGAA